jgi:hypothetical protein
MGPNQVTAKRHQTVKVKVQTKRRLLKRHPAQQAYKVAPSGSLENLWTFQSGRSQHLLLLSYWLKREQRRLRKKS